jgi:hypothetical protein
VSQKTTYYHPDGSVSLEKTLIVTGTNLEVRVQQLERENAVLRLALDQQANYQRELRADRDRLDDLQRNKWQVHWTGHNWYVSSPKGKYFPDIRQAIDAAREEQP